MFFLQIPLVSLEEYCVYACMYGNRERGEREKRRPGLEVYIILMANIWEKKLIHLVLVDAKENK